MKQFILILLVGLCLISCKKEDFVTYQVTSNNASLVIKYLDETGTIKETSVNTTSWNYMFLAKKKDNVYLEVNSWSQDNSIKVQIYYKNKLLKTSEDSGQQPSVTLEGNL